MSCERFRNALTDAAAGEPVAEALEVHLGACGACASELAELRRLMAAADDDLSILATAEPSPALRVRIREAVTAPTPAPTVRWAFAWTATAAAVLALAVVTLWRSSPPRPSASPALALQTPETRPTAASSPVVVADLSSSAGPGLSRSPSESTHRATSVRSTRAVRRSVRTEPEVLVPPGEAEAFLRFASHLQTRVVTAESILLADLSGPMPDPRPLEIRPLSDAASDSDSSGTD